MLRSQAVSPAPPTVKETEDLDPELVSLRRSLPFGPLLVASVLGFAVVLMVRLRDDLAYSRQPETPADLGRITDLKGPFPDNAHVSLIGEIDASAPGRLRGLQNTGYRLTPLLGTGQRVWVHEPGEAIDVKPTYDGVLTGRLRRLDDMPFGATLRGYVAGLPPQPRFVFPEALTPSGLPPTDVHGDPLAPGPDTPVVIEEIVTGVAIVNVVKTDTITDVAAAKRELARAEVGTATLAEQADKSWSFEVEGDPAAIAAKLRQGHIFGAEARPKVVARKGKASELTVTAGQVTLGGFLVPRAAIDHIELDVTPVIPADAWVLLTGDSPARLWYMAPLYIGLGVIALLMGWALAVAIRHLRKQRADSPV